MGLPATFPWQCAALTCLPAVILAAIATGIPMWSQFQNGALPANEEFEYGMWEACTILQGVRRCGTPWHQPGQPCYGLIVSFQVCSMIGLAFLFFGMMACCALFKKPIKGLALVAMCCLFVALAFMITGFSLWITIAEKPLCGFFGEPIRNYGPSFILWVVATALASMALCLTCFGFLAAVTHKVGVPKVIEEEIEEIEYIEEPVFQYPSQYPAASAFAAPAATYISGGAPTYVSAI